MELMEKRISINDDFSIIVCSPCVYLTDFIDDILNEKLDIGKIIKYNPEFKIKVREYRNSNSLLERIKGK